MPFSPKVLVVSFDGGVWSNLIPLAKSGIMPNLLKILEEGKYGNLESTIPPVTPPAWTAFMTGCNPAKTGIFDFYEYDFKTYKTSLVSSNSIQVPTLWEILSDNGIKVGIIDVPINFPPKKVNGFLISGWERPTNKKVFTYPPELGEKLIQKLGDYPICLTTFDRLGSKDVNYIDSLINITSKVGDAALWLLDEEKTDFFMVHFQTTDIIQHGFWHEIQGMDFNSQDAVVQKIWEFYKNLDKYLGLIREKQDADGTFFLVSDHGFGPVKRRMALNVWLMENGYLKLKKDLSTKIQANVTNNVVRFANKIDALARLKKRIKWRAQENLEQRVIVPKSQIDPIDYTKTRAFSSVGTVYGTIHLNIAGREKEGTIPQNEAESLKEEIIQKLKNIRDPFSGEIFIKEIHKKEDIYSGLHLDKIPDLILIPNEGHCFFQGTSEKSLFCPPHKLSPGNHVQDGIIAVVGPLSRTIDLEGCKITDFAPTILELFRLRTTPNMDGKSLLTRNEYLLLH